MSILLHVNVTELEFYLNNRKVNNQIDLTKNILNVGRAKQYRYKQDYFSYSNIKNLSLTNYTNNLIEKVLCSLQNKEKALLIAKTGIGKTYTLQILGKALGQSVQIVNLSRNTDISELIGGWKPSGQNFNLNEQQKQELIQIIDEITNAYINMNIQSNIKFVQNIKQSIQQNNCEQMIKYIKKILQSIQQYQSNSNVIKLQQIYEDFIQNEKNYNFTYIEGPLIQAAENGSILILDEINMANDEVLQWIQYFIADDYIDKFDKQLGQIVRKQKHINFKIVAAMNPGNDVGKRDLPLTLKQMFTIMNLQEMNQNDDLLQLIQTYIGKSTYSTQILNLFKDLQQVQQQFQTISQQSVCYSIRQLCRVLVFIQKFPQQIYSGFILYFGSQLGKSSKQRLIQILKKHLGDKCDQNQRIQYNIQLTPYLLQNTFLVNVIDGIQFPVGPLFDKTLYDLSKPLVEQDSSYIITESNRQQIKSILLSLIAGTSLLLQGVTSSGKSSIIKYLAKLLGYRLTRLNNHQNTELSDYLGTYQPTSNGSLQFQYGPLINSMQNGEWILLDELNLCSNEILESLNRLLDDNHEIYIPETNEILHPKPGFALFATQNPSGIIGNQTYGGRNMLSDAFINRFNLIEFNEATTEELKFILSNRKESRLLPPKFIDIIITITQNLRMRLAHTLTSIDADITPQIITLRDVFKIADSMPDSIQNLAISLYIILCERQRSKQTKNEIIQEINKYCNTNLSEDFMQEFYEKQIQPYKELIKQQFPTVAFTSQLSKMLYLALYCHKNKNNLLLISEAGCGKTQATQIIQRIYQQQFKFINLHKNSDSAELIGQIRPVENQHMIQKRILNLEQQKQYISEEFYNQELQQLQSLNKQVFSFEYGPLVKNIFMDQQMLLDEINLANDAVIERLNSLFEYDSELMLQETNEQILIKPSTTFDIIATMNPGNDYGKKELSPAMRSRMLEVYISNMNKDDIIQIIDNRNHAMFINNTKISEFIADFYMKFKDIINTHFNYYRITFSIRDIIMLYDMIIKQYQNKDNITVQEFIQIFQITFFDGLKIRCPQLQLEQISQLQQQVYTLLNDQQQQDNIKRDIVLGEIGIEFIENNKVKHVIKYGNNYNRELSIKTYNSYALNAPTTQYNAFRIAACINNGSNNNIIIESDPGVGKTSLIQSLANISGNNLIRINLSEHIELSDLLGQEIPNNDQNQPFKYQIGPLSQAIIDDCWVLLDEINLANQQVLEGLNSLLDYRGSIFIPEIQQQLTIKSNFRLFAAQNSPTQKAGRKQLPQSFMNRFLTLYLYNLTQQDYKFICNNIQFSDKDKSLLLELLNQLQKQVNKTCCFIGGPYEVNLRDIYRIYDLININKNIQIKEALIVLFIMRFRCEEDYQIIYDTINNIYNDKIEYPLLSIQDNTIYLGKNKFSELKNNNQLTIMSSNYFIQCAIQIIMNSQIPLLLTTNQNLSYIDQILSEYSILSNKQIITIDFSKQTDVTQIVGQYVYQNQQFVWQDSIIVEAIKQGNIIHIKNANFCSYAVLDRLNSLLERNGSLTIFESGITETIYPHKDFRIILSYNYNFSDVSSAIRNRCVEICVDSNQWIVKQIIKQQMQIIDDIQQEIKYDSLCNCNYRLDSYNSALIISKCLQKSEFDIKTLFTDAKYLKYDNQLLRQQSIDRLQYIEQIFKQQLQKLIIQKQKEKDFGQITKEEFINISKSLFQDIQLILTYDYSVSNKQIDQQQAQDLLQQYQKVYYKYTDILYSRQIIDRMLNKQKYQLLDKQQQEIYHRIDYNQQDLNIIKTLFKQQFNFEQIHKISQFNNNYKQNIIQSVLYCSNIKYEQLINVMKQYNLKKMEQYQQGVKVYQTEQFTHDIQQLYNWNIQNWNITEKQIQQIKSVIIQVLVIFNNAEYSKYNNQQIKEVIIDLLQSYSFENIMDKSLLNKNTMTIYNQMINSLDLSLKCLIECNCVQYGMKFEVDSDLRQSLLQFKEQLQCKIQELEQQTSNIQNQSTYIQSVHELTQSVDQIIQKSQQYNYNMINSLQNLVQLLIKTQNYAIIDNWFDISIQLTLLTLLVLISFVQQIEINIYQLNDEQLYNIDYKPIDIQYIVEFAQNINQSEIQQLQLTIQQNQLIKSKYEQEITQEQLNEDVKRIMEYKQNQIESYILQNSKLILNQYNIDNKYYQQQKQNEDLSQLQEQIENLFKVLNSDKMEWPLYSQLQQYIKCIYNSLQYNTKQNQIKGSSVNQLSNLYITNQSQDILNQIYTHNNKLLEQFENTQSLIDIKEQIDVYRNINQTKMSWSENLKFLEKIYQYIQQFNQRAPKSLQYEVNNIKKQIVKLRRLELFSWQNFINQIQYEINDTIICQLPQMIIAVIKASKSDQYQQLEKDLLTSFIQLQQGQVAIYIQVIQFLIQFLNDMSNSEIQSQIPYVNEVKELLQKFYCSIKPCSEFIIQNINEKQKPIIKKYIQQIKLFKYDIRNFYKLKDDIDASHRMIVKLLSQYKDILYQGIYETYQQYQTKYDRIQQPIEQLNNINSQQKEYQIIQILKHFHDEKLTINQQQLVLSQLISDLLIQNNNDIITALKILIKLNNNINICQIVDFYYKIQQLVQSNNVQEDVQPKIQQIIQCINSQIIILVQSINYQEINYNYSMKIQQQILNKMIQQQLICINNSYSHKLVSNVEKINQLLKLLNQQNITQDTYSQAIQVLQSSIEIIEQNYNKQISYQHQLMLEQIKSLYEQIDFSANIQFQTFTFTEQQQLQIQYVEYIIQSLYSILKSGYLPYQEQQEQKQKQDKQQNGIGFGDGQAEKDITDQVKQEQLNDDQLLGEQNQQCDDQQQQQENQQKDEEVSGINMDNLDDGDNQSVQEEQQEQDDQLDKEMTDQDQQNIEQADQLSNSDQIDNKEQLDDVEGNQNSNQENNEDEDNQSINDEEQVLSSIESDQQDADNSLSINSEEFQDNQEDQDNNELSNLFDEMFKEDIEQQQIEQEEQNSITFDQEQLSQVDQKSDINEESDEKEYNQDQQVDDQQQEQQEQDVKQDQLENSDEFKADIQEEQQAQQGNEQQDNQSNQKQQSNHQGDKGEDNEEQDKKQEQEQLFEQKQLEEAQEDDDLKDATEQDIAYVQDEEAQQQMKITEALKMQEHDKQEQEEKQENSSDDIIIQLPDAQLNIQNIYDSQYTKSKAFLLKTKLNVILSPTEATQLIGDFKTGKKLNMKKIVQFFASNFRKDKIWLRRQKAEEKKYNIIMAVDNSYSIQQQPQVAQQLLQALFIIQEAFKDMGTVQTYAFGTGVIPLPQVEQVGVNRYLQLLQQQLVFADTSTNFKLLFETVANQFEKAVLNTNNIFILLTDGRISSDKADINTLYRKLTHDYKVIAVPVLFDSTLFELQSIKFTTVNNKRCVQKVQYFADEYPLSNYMVCDQNQDIVDVLINSLVTFLSK